MNNALRCIEGTNIGDATRCIGIGEDLYPGNGKRFMEQEKHGWFKGNTEIFDSHANSMIIISELFETDGRGYIIVIGDFTAKDFLPFFPTRNMVSCP